MMLRHLGEQAAADAVFDAVDRSLEAGEVRTADLGGNSNTMQMATAIANTIARR